MADSGAGSAATGSSDASGSEMILPLAAIIAVSVIVYTLLLISCALLCYMLKVRAALSDKYHACGSAAAAQGGRRRGARRRRRGARQLLRIPAHRVPVHAVQPHCPPQAMLSGSFHRT